MRQKASPGRRRRSIRDEAPQNQARQPEFIAKSRSKRLLCMGTGLAERGAP